MAGVFLENWESLSSSRRSSKLEGPLSYLPETTTGHSGPGSWVGVATDYGLDGPRSNPGGDEIFRLSRLALGPPNLLYNGYRVFPGGKVRPGRAADHSSPFSATVMGE